MFYDAIAIGILQIVYKYAKISNTKGVIMENDKYITIGFPNINKDIFRQVLRPLDNYSFKPTGGLWACKYLGDVINISEWLNFLLTNYDLTRQKNITDGVIFTLKNDAKIIKINNYNDVENLSSLYPSYHHILNYYDNYNTLNNITFDFEALGNYYDGIYVNYYSILNEGKTQIFNKWDVNSLLLFNLDCIDSYESIEINVNLNGFYCLPFIKEKEGSTKIAKESDEYQKLFLICKKILLESINSIEGIKYNDYDEFLESCVESIGDTIEVICQANYIYVTDIQNTLKNQGIDVTKEHIVRNIVFNCFADYLKQEHNSIINLSKSLNKKVKRYIN